ncbi:MAG: DUF3307 domain-containing protein [Flavisolibacter sp.]
MNLIWLVKLILAHLLTDFVLQRTSWVTDKKQRHFSSGFLYLHTFITAAVALLFIGWNYWLIAIVIFVTHTLIDGWKSYKPDESKYFLIDQLLHLLVIVICWLVLFFSFGELKEDWLKISEDTHVWIITTALVFLTLPSSILIGELTRKWRQNLVNPQTLANAGKWIGIIERVIIFILVLRGQFEAMGLLIAAKSIIRFSENNRPEEKTEYLVIGTLISLSIALIVGLIVKRMIF